MPKAPVVYIHGMFGWGNTTRNNTTGPKHSWVHRQVPYWPTSVLEELNPATEDVNHHDKNIMVQVGAGASDHDRAVEAFYQIYGGRVDYGEEHSTRCGHSRYGSTYEAGYYSAWDAQHPVHLIGHSLGATTAIELYQLLCQDFFNVGSNSNWVTSITSIAGPLSGSTLVHSFGVDTNTQTLQPITMGHVFSVILSACWKFQQCFPYSKNIFNLHMSQWEDSVDWKSIWSVSHAFNSSADNAYNCLTPSYRAKRNSKLVQMDKVFLFSVACAITSSSTEENKDVDEVAALRYYAPIVLCILYHSTSSWLHFTVLVIIMLICKTTKMNINMTDGTHWTSKLLTMWWKRNNVQHTFSSHSATQYYHDDGWEINDGIVNTNSMKSALVIDRIPKMQPIDTANDEFVRGCWYYHRIENKNHFCGTSFDPHAREMYTDILNRLEGIE